MGSVAVLAFHSWHFCAGICLDLSDLLWKCERLVVGNSSKDALVAFCNGTEFFSSQAGRGFLRTHDALSD